MAVIYSYPVKSSPELTDKMLISDGTDNLTKQVTISGVKDTIDVVDSLAATLPIEVSASSGAVTVSSRAYAGAATTGYVPTGGSATTFLRGDGWMGEYLKMYRDDKVFICPLGKWVEIESPEVEFPCYKGLMRCSLIKLKHWKLQDQCWN